MHIKKYIYRYVFLIPLVIIAIVLSFCNEPADEKAEIADSASYKNHLSTVKYVGMVKCRECHTDKYNSFIETGMGKSFDVASKAKSSGDFTHDNTIYDKYIDMYYKSFWENDKLKFLEFRKSGRDTVFSHSEYCSYIIGSGQHTNSHLINTNGYIHQMPMTYYTQKGKWDLPPGFENGLNTRFDRKIGLECMACHNGYPDFVMGSENKYNSVPNGIDCERCHGPGQAHVEQFMNGSSTDTSKYIDYSIVNPAKLSIDLQFDLCSRCHLQGNAVLKEGKSWYDYKPGMKLSEFWTVFLPKYKNADDEFIMASHADRLKQSKCFLESMKKADSKALRPYKQALTCVTCHNPHVSVKQTRQEVFNSACRNCHKDYKHVLNAEYFTDKKDASLNNCFGCHMPKSSSTDIPHVSVTDHYIRIPVSKKQKEKVKEFIGLFAINEKNPPLKIKVQAYVAQFEKFEGKSYCLDSALQLIKINSKEDVNEFIHELVNIYFIKGEYSKLVSFVNELGDQELLIKKLRKQTYDNKDAWTSYRIAQALIGLNDLKRADGYLKNATELAPFNLDFQNKYGTNLFSLGKYDAAKKVYEFVINEYPRHVSALVNLGYIYLNERNDKKAEELFNKALYYNPDHEMALMNKAGLYLYRGENSEAKKLLLQIAKKFPGNSKARKILKSM